MSNPITLEGTAGRIPTLTYLGDGTAQAVIPISTVGEGGTDKTWWRVTILGPQAEAFTEQVSVGDSVIIQGRAYQGTYLKDGEQRQSLEVAAHSAAIVPKPA